MARFVLLEHDHPHLHWDLMLEVGAVLWTWRLTRPPDAMAPVEALRTPDHRVMYLSYEGPVSGNRGVVRRWDAGVFTWLSSDETGMQVRLEGNRLAGVLRLIHQEEAKWQAFYEPDSSR